jgi:zona occludens toxin (predicted ATPase)
VLHTITDTSTRFRHNAWITVDIMPRIAYNGYSIRETIGLVHRSFTLCENGGIMAHRDRNEQRAIKVRKDPNKLARGTQIHKVRKRYQPADIANDIAEYFSVTHGERHDKASND